MLDTVSITITTSPESCATFVSSLIGFRTPVDVSECTTETTSYWLPFSASASISGVCAAPNSTSSLSQAMPEFTAALWKRLLKAPLIRQSSRALTALRTPPSIRPVAEDVTVYTGCVVRNTFGSRSSMRVMIASISEPRWLIIGRDIVARISGFTSVGPGRKNFPNEDMRWEMGDVRTDSHKSQLPNTKLPRNHAKTTRINPYLR